jgi:hypothetical protein
MPRGRSYSAADGSAPACVLASKVAEAGRQDKRGHVQTAHCVALALALSAAGAPARAAPEHDYPTVDRVEYVLECMQRNAGKQEFLYKCACVIDEIAKQYTYDDFVEASTAARFQSLGGERGGVFRDPPKTRDTAKRYMQVRSDAMKRCDVPR